MDDLTETTVEVLRNRRETHQGFGPIVELIASNHENHVKLKRLVRSLVLVGTIPDTKSLARIYSNVGITSLPSKVADALLPGLLFQRSNRRTKHGRPDQRARVRRAYGAIRALN